MVVYLKIDLSTRPVKKLALNLQKMENLEEKIIDPRLKIGPQEGVSYPISVTYCGNCTMPIEVSKLSNA